MMEAVRTSETSVDNNFTRQYMTEDNSEHHTRRSENLKSHTEGKDIYQTGFLAMKFEVLKALKLLFWVVLPSVLVKGHRRFREVFSCIFRHSSDTLLATYKATPRHNPEDCNRDIFELFVKMYPLRKKC
jgi:hypothetical protein